MPGPFISGVNFLDLRIRRSISLPHPVVKTHVDCGDLVSIALEVWVSDILYFVPRIPNPRSGRAGFGDDGMMGCWSRIRNSDGLLIREKIRIFDVILARQVSGACHQYPNQDMIDLS